jgi:hypothetical protein
MEQQGMYIFAIQHDSDIEVYSTASPPFMLSADILFVIIHHVAGEDLEKMID